MNDAIPIALLVSFIWGVAPIIQKRVMSGIDQTLMMVLSNVVYTTCLVFFASYNWPTIKEQASKITPNLMMWIAGTAVISGFFASLLYYHLLKHNDAYLVSALVSLSPAFTLLIAWIALDQEISDYGFWGVIIILIGIGVLAMDK